MATTPQATGFREQPTAQGRRFRLPPRPYLAFRVFGMLLMGGASLALVGVLSYLAQALFASAQPTQVTSVIVASALSLPMMLTIALGWFMAWGYTEIVLDGNGLKARERIGPFAMFNRRIERTSIVGFEVHQANVRVNDQPIESGPWAEVGSLIVRMHAGGHRVLATMYPIVTLQAAGTRLAQELGLEARDAAESALLVPIVRRQDERSTPTEKPAHSMIHVEIGEDGTMFRIPARSLKSGGVSTVFFFSIIWLAFVAAITASIAFVALAGGGSTGGTGGSGGGTVGNPWVMISFLAAFWAVGIGMLTYGIHLRSRQAIIDVLNDAILVSRRSIFGIRQHHWARDELQSIRCRDSNVRVNDRALKQMQIKSKDGGEVRLLTGMNEDELQWLVNEISLRLGLTEPADGPQDPTGDETR